MKPRLQTSLGQHLVMTPQLRQAIRLLQMSTAELEIELTEAVETNPLLDWSEPGEDAGPPRGADDAPPPGEDPRDERAQAQDEQDHERAAAGEPDDWSPDEGPWTSSGGGGSFDDDDGGSPAERVAEADTLHGHLLWQLHLSHLSARDRRIGAALIDALEDDGYLREPLSGIAQTLLPEIEAAEEDILVVLHQVQRFDPVGVAARSLGECLQLQLSVLGDDTPGKALALTIAETAL